MMKMLLSLIIEVVMFHIGNSWAVFDCRMSLHRYDHIGLNEK